MIKEKAYAKLNLHLQVVGKREDDYHLLNTLFVRISLHDLVMVEAIREPAVELSISGPYRVPQGAKNIAHKAARWYLKRYGIRGWGVKILIEKRIPPAGGLGGGSADAAAVIRAMVRFFGERDPKMVEESAEIGADVPFLLSDYSVALASGIGERLRPVEADLSAFKFHLFTSEEGLSTKDVFELFDKLSEEAASKHPPLEEDAIVEVAKSCDLERFKKRFFNHLEIPVFRIRPDLEELKRKLIKRYPFVLLSGSGPTLYAVTEADGNHPEDTPFVEAKVV